MADPIIDRGAILAAAAKTLGISPDEAMDLISRRQAKVAKKRGVDISTDQLIDQFAKRAAGVAEINADIPADIDEYRTIPNNQVEFGEDGNQDILQNFLNPEEAEKARGKRDANEFIKYEKVKRKGGKSEVRQRQIVLGENERLMDEELRERAILRDFGLRVDRDDLPRGPKNQQQGWIRRGANVAPLVGPLLEGQERPLRAPAGNEEGGGRRLFRGANGQEVKNPWLVDEKVVPFNAAVAPAPRISSEAELAANQARIANENAVARELIRRDREGQPPEEVLRRARAQLGREINVDLSGTGQPAVGRAENRVLNNGQPVAWRVHPFANASPNMGGATGPSPEIRALREQQLIAEMQKVRQNSQMVENNNYRANALAQEFARHKFGINGVGARADQAIENIGVIGKLGKAMPGRYAPIDYQVAPVVRPPRPDSISVWPGADFPVQADVPVDVYEGRRYDYDALPVDLAARYNAPSAPDLPTAQVPKHIQFIADYMPGFKEQGAFGNFPQVGINEQIEAARGALGAAKFKGQAVDVANARLRNLADLQAAADAVVALGQAKGQNFFKREDGKNVRVENPGINEVLQRGGMNARQVGDVAKAFFAIEAAKRNPINREAKEQFFLGKPNPVGRPVAFGGDHPALGGGEAQIAMLRGEKIKGKEVRAQLQALDGRRGNPGEPLNVGELAQARMPFIGGVAGEEIPRAQFVRGEDRGLSREALIAKHGEVNGAIAARLNERAGQMTGNQSDGFGLGADQSIQRESAQRPSMGQTFEVMPNVHIKNNLNMMENPERVAAGIARARQEAAANKNPALRQVVKERGQFRFAKPAGRAPITDIKLPPQVSAPSAAPEREEIYVGGGDGQAMRTSAAGGDVPKWKRMGYMVQPDLASRNNRKNREIIKRAERGQVRRATAAGAGAALAGMIGLDALIGGERDRREEEVYA